MMKILLALTFLAPWTAIANNEEYAVSTQTGANIYLVVTPGKGASARDPGFYTRHGNDWSAAVLGTIALHPQTGPILTQFKVSESDRRSLSAALVDGYLTLFSLDSKSEIPNSVIRIGSLNWPVIHPITHTPVHLLPVYEAKRIAIVESHHPAPSNESVIYGSIQFEGDQGVTFAFKLGPVLNGQVSLKSDLVLIDQAYYDQNKLAALASQSKGYHVRSPEVEKSVVGFLKREYKSDFDVLFTEWRKSMSYFVDLDNLGILTTTPPFFLLAPPARLQSGTFSQYQVIDPINHQRFLTNDIVALSSGNFNGPNQAPINGTVDLDTTGKPLYRITAANNHLSMFEVMSVNKMVKLLIWPRKPIDMPYNLSTEPVSDFSIKYLHSAEKDNQTVHYLLYSYVTNNRSHTELLAVSLRDGAIRKVRTIEIKSLSAKFYSQEELEWRCRLVNSNYGKPAVLFDDAKEMTRRPADELLNLTESIRSNGNTEIFGVPELVGGNTNAFVERTAAEARLVILGSNDEPKTIWTAPNRNAILKVRHLDLLATGEGHEKQELFVIHVQETQEKPAKIYFLLAVHRHTGFETEIFEPAVIEKMNLSSAELFSRIYSVGAGESARWVFDKSPAKDRTSLLDIRATVSNRQLHEDELGQKTVAERLEANELEKKIEEIFPEIQVKAAVNGVVALTSQDNVPLGEFLFGKWPTRDLKSNSPFKFYKLDGPEAGTELALFPYQNSPAHHREYVGGLWSFVDESGRRVYRAVQFLSDKLNYSGGLSNKDLVEVKILPHLDGSPHREIILVYKEEKPNIPESHGEDKGKKKHSPGESIVSIQQNKRAFSWTMALSRNLQQSIAQAFSFLGNVSESSDLNLHLASMDAEWYWVTHGADSFLSKGLELKSFNSGNKIEPNSSHGRLLRSKIKYLVPPENRPTGASEGRFYFNGSWKAMDHEVPKSLINSAVQSSPFANRLFSGILQQIEDYLAPKATYRPMILIVPEEIQGMLGKFLSDSFDAGNESSRWSQRSHSIRFFIPPKRQMTQYEIVDNIEVIANVEPSRNLVLTDIDNLVANKNPTNPDRKSLFAEAKTIQVKADMVEQAGQIVIKEDANVHFPHLSFVLASQGDGSLGYEDLRNRPHQFRFPMIAMGTKAAWDTFMLDPNNEFLNYGGEAWFDLVQVEAPSVDAKVNLLLSIVDTPEIRSLKYKYDSKGISKKGSVLSESEAQKSVLRHAVNRIETLSRSSEQNPFTIYLKFLGIFSQSLIKDKEARRTQTIDKAFVERVLTQLFNIPLSRSFLPEDDPLFLLSKNDAPIKLQDAGYNGQMALKQQILEVLRSPLMPSQAKTIPSSMILAGDTGTGKSHFFQSLVKMLSLKLYDFDPQNPTANDDANAIILRADKLVAAALNRTTGQTGSATMTVEDAISHLDNFLSLPLGYRGYIFIDDLHGAPAEVREQLLIYLRGLFESPGGIYSTKAREFKAASGRAIKINDVSRPVRGLNLIAAMNFTENMETVEKFTKKGEPPTLEQIILATLSTRNHNIETSFLRRWGAIIPLSSFPVEAKGPGVVEGFRKKMQSMLELQSRFAFLSTETIRAVAKQFSATDARTFLTEATNAFYDMANTDALTGSVRIIAPLLQGEVATLQGAEVISRSVGSGSTGEIAKYIGRHAQVLDLGAGVEGQLHLLKLIVASFRLALLERFVAGVQENPTFAYTQADQRQNLYPLLHAIHDYIGNTPDIPISIFNLDSNKFGLKQKEQKTQFAATLAKIDRLTGRGSFFPVSFNDNSQSGMGYRELVNVELQVASQPTRRTVLNQYSTLLRPLFEEELAAQLRLESLIQIPNPVETWFESLRRGEPGNEGRLGKRMTELYLEFRQALYADDLAESHASASVKPLSGYATARLFLYVIDHAITKMAWTEAIQFFAKVTEAAADDMVLSQSSGFHYLLNESKRSPYNIKTIDYLLSVVSNFPAFESDFNDLRSRQRDRFKEDCGAILSH